MRRKDRECNTSEFFDEVLSKAEVIFLAMGDGEFPYCLPFNFAREGEKIYIHSAKEGKKLECLRQHPEVAFSTAVDIRIDQVVATTYYKSVAGRGLAAIVDDEMEKGHALDLLGSRYQAHCQRPAPARDINRVAIIRIDILELTGKKCLPQS